MSTPTTDPTGQPSAGAVRAAKRFRAEVVGLSDESTDLLARLIDRETHAKALLDALRPFAKLGDTKFKGSVWEGRDVSASVFFHHETDTEITVADFYLASEVVAKSEVRA